MFGWANFRKEKEMFFVKKVVGTWAPRRAQQTNPCNSLLTQGMFANFSYTSSYSFTI